MLMEFISYNLRWTGMRRRGGRGRRETVQRAKMEREWGGEGTEGDSAKSEDGERMEGSRILVEDEDLAQRTPSEGTPLLK